MLTKQAINKLKSSPIEVRLWNGCFNKATAIAKYSGNKSYELTVEVTHPYLQWQCGDKNEVKITLWKGYTGTHCEIPEELEPLIEDMKTKATMQDDFALDLSNKNKYAFTEAMKELGIL